jgi:hypothetical protein
LHGWHLQFASLDSGSRNVDDLLSEAALPPEFERLLEEVWQAEALGQFDGTLAAYQRVVERARLTLEFEMLSSVLRNFGTYAFWMGQPELAESALCEALELHRALHDLAGEGWCLIVLGRLAITRGEVARARELSGANTHSTALRSTPVWPARCACRASSPWWRTTMKLPPGIWRRPPTCWPR